MFLTNDHVNIKENTTCEVIKTKKSPIQILLIELHNELIKPPSEGGFDGAILESGQVIVEDTLIGKYMPPQVKNDQSSQGDVWLLNIYICIYYTL